MIRIGLELEYLWDPTTVQYGAISTHLAMIGLIKDTEKIPYIDMRKIVRKYISSSFDFFEVVEDGELEELVFPPYTSDQLEGLRPKFNTLFNFLSTYGFKVVGDKPIGCHHSIDLDLFNLNSFEHFFQCVFDIRKVLYDIAKRTGRSTRKSDMIHMIGDIHKYHNEEEHKIMFKTYLDLLKVGFKSKTNINVLNTTLLPRSKKTKKILNILQLEWYNSVTNFTDMMIQIEFTESLVAFTLGPDRGYDAYIKFIRERGSYDRLASTLRN